MQMRKLIFIPLLLLQYLSVIAQTVSVAEAYPSKGSIVLNQSASYFMQSPQRLLDYWGDEVLAVSQYSEKERSFQEKVNETLAKTFVLAHAESKDEDFTNDNYRLPLEQRLIDNEPITPYTWKWVSFEIRPESGGVESVKLCRPNWFLRQLGATALGKMVYLSIPETGIMGNAIVTQISPCQLDTRLLAPKQKGEYEYRPITGQFQHQQAEVWDFEFSDGSIIGVTANHPFFSLERGTYTPVGDLKIGEAVKNVGDKTLTLTKKTLRPNPETVYNLEVYRDHTYLVGNDGVLVHNACDWDNLISIAIAKGNYHWEIADGTFSAVIYSIEAEYGDNIFKILGDFNKEAIKGAAKKIEILGIELVNPQLIKIFKNSDGKTLMGYLVQYTPNVNGFPRVSLTKNL